MSCVREGVCDGKAVDEHVDVDVDVDARKGMACSFAGGGVGRFDRGT